MALATIRTTNPDASRSITDFLGTHGQHLVAALDTAQRRKQVEGSRWGGAPRHGRRQS
jgi:hypothetical protein